MSDISSPLATTVTEGIHFQPDIDLIAIGKNEKGDTDMFTNVMVITC
jgi:hypothetical protein